MCIRDSCNTSASHLHAVAKIHVQILFLGLLLNHDNKLSDFLVSLFLTRMHPSAGLETIVDTHTVTDLIHCKTWQWQCKCCTTTIHTVCTNFRSGAPTETQPSSSTRI